MRYVLDTTLLADHVNGDPRAIEMLNRLFSEPHELYTCDVVVCESLSVGSEDERAAVGALIDALEYVATDPRAARWAAESRREAHGRGGKRGVGDALIAGVATHIGATVVTRNVRDFERQGIAILPY